MPQYSLCQHVYMCITRDYVAFLDMKNDAYLGLSLAKMSSISSHLRGWQLAVTDINDQAHRVQCAETHTALENLIQHEILTPDHHLGKCVASTPFETPTTALIDTIFTNTLFDDEGTIEPATRLRDVWYFFQAYVTAASMKRWWSLSRIVQHVRARKQRAPASRQSTDIALARTPVWIFRRIRPFFFSKKDACFLESLALLEFLAHYAIFPNWIFGVATGPFTAHCWVQSGDVVFNDSPFNLRTFTPILVV